MTDGYEIPRTLAERNEGLTDFWEKGFNFGLEMAVDHLRGEARWQEELRHRGNPHSASMIDRLLLLANIVESLKKPDVTP